MADNIKKFEDYKKRENGEDFDIEIEDPYNFFNASEREEYFKERQKEQQKAIEKRRSEDEYLSDSAEEKDAPKNKREKSRKDDYNEKNEREEEYDSDEEYDEEDYEDYVEEQEDYEEDYEDEEPEEKYLMLVVVRIASIITGIIILFFVGVILKDKVFDKLLRPDPDEAPAQEVELALPEGYTPMGDTVVVTADSLNLRTVPSAESKSTVVASVTKGTQLKRIAQDTNGSWAIVELDGQQYYASSKYLASP